ncbi:LysR family transcriptional regulator substrate-binding protein [Pseudoflavonifractor sp. MSJ-37]|nr:LysR family transcriptional regulator substrate-binding protein [Pseudoflavonifractor sp. MSJ-37]
MLLLEEGCYSEPLEAFRAAGLTPDVRLTMHDDYSILSMVEQGLGYSLLAELVLQKTAYDVAVCPVREPISRTIALVMKDSRALSAAARTFMRSIVREVAADRIAGDICL